MDPDYSGVALALVTMLMGRALRKKRPTLTVGSVRGTATMSAPHDHPKAEEFKPSRQVRRARERAERASR